MPPSPLISGLALRQLVPVAAWAAGALALCAFGGEPQNGAKGLLIAATGLTAGAIALKEMLLVQPYLTAQTLLGGMVSGEPVAVLKALSGVSHLIVQRRGGLAQMEPELLTVMPTEGHSETNLLRLAASLGQADHHPLAQTLVQAAQRRQIGLLKPFAVRSAQGHGISGIVDGRSVSIGTGGYLESLHIPLTLRSKSEPYKSQGQTVIYVAMDGHCIGLVMFRYALYPGMDEGLRGIRQMGVKVSLRSADDARTLAAISRKFELEVMGDAMMPEGAAWLGPDEASGGACIVCLSHRPDVPLARVRAGDGAALFNLLRLARRARMLEQQHVMMSAGAAFLLLVGACWLGPYQALAAVSVFIAGCGGFIHRRVAGLGLA